MITSFLMTALLIELTPGPNMAYLALTSAVEGRRPGFAAAAGMTLGLTIIGAIAAAGVAIIVDSSRPVYQVLRWGGALYLLWLAWRTWVGEREVSSVPMAEQQSAMMHFRRGLTINLLNPKAGLFFIAILPTFIDPTLESLRQTAVLTFLYLLVATTVHVSIVALAGHARQFVSSPERQSKTRKFFALLLLGVAIWFAFSLR